MHSFQTQDLALTHFQGSEDPSRDILADWPLYRDKGSASTAMVYFELEPGKHLGNHRDSAEELLVVLSGEVEAVVGSERRRVAAGGMALVPPMALHDVVSVGSETAKVAGIFPSNTIVSIFEEGFSPSGARVVGTPPPVEAVPEAV
jgi:quercetin dioxygenase-like cupin family protein